MTLLPLQNSEIILPEIKLKDTKIGGNRVLRFGVISHHLEVTVYESQHDGWYELRTGESSPYDKIYLRKPGRRAVAPNQALCLDFVSPNPIATLDASKKLRWIQHHLAGDMKTPDEIVSSWAGKFSFCEDRPELGQVGLRAPQLGALHAISAYFSVKRNLDSAIVVLPTGTGKTETMLSVMVYRQLPKVLIIVPSNSLRDQISHKFYELGELSRLGLVPANIALPSVVSIKIGIKSITEASELIQHANVFIATASVLNSSDSAAVDRLCAGITDLFIDEAHHSTASTWARIKEKFAQKRIVQFTATPFRNNGTSLGGRIIYNYTMGEAQESNYFKHIDLIPVEEYYKEKQDRSIALAAIERLKSDLSRGYDHLLMARVQKKHRADEVFQIYQELSPPEFNPIIIYSGMSKRDVQSSLDALFNRNSRIVICVNMLGEGFDLPSLKVAAIHDIHKSLAITLQFIGRFTRASDGNASVVVNVAEPEVEMGLQYLYAQGADWDNVLKRLSEKRIEREVKLQEVVEGLKKKGNLHQQLSLWNLRPSCSAIMFRTTCDAWNPQRFEETLPVNTEYWFAISEEEKMLVVLALHEAPVKWGNYKDLNDSVYKLLIVHWDEERSGLFVFANDYKWFRVEKTVELLCDGQCELLSGPKVFNVFNGLRYPLVRNLGAAQVGAISFTQYFGSNVTDGLSSIESKKSYLSNLAGLGYDNGERVIWGCSQKKGKIWSVNSGSISDWRDWVKTAWDKVAKGETDEANITRDFLRPKRLSEPHLEHAIAIQWGEHIQADPEENVIILFGDTEVPLYLVDLKILSQEKGRPYRIAISSDTLSSVYEFTIAEGLVGGFGYRFLSGDELSVRRGSTVIPIHEYLQKDPWIIQYVSGSYSYNCFLIELPETIGEFDGEQIECWGWDGVDIQKESMGKERATDTVQWKTFERIKDQYDVIVNDDGSGEAADLIGLKIDDNKILLGLVHCKYSGAQTPGARVGDLYEVCGQAQKSIHRKHGGIARLYGHIKGREKIWRDSNVSRFLKGSMSDLASIKQRGRTAPIKLQVYIVQPGLKKDSVTQNMLRVLGSTAIYLKNTAQAELIVVGSRGSVK